MATSTKAQSTPMANNWEDIDSVESVEKQMSKVKILNRSSQEKKDEPDVDQPSKLVPDTASVIMVSPEEQNRTQYVPESKVLIMKRPTQDGLSNAANKPKQPVKTLEQRQAEYKEARLRILGNAEPEEKKGSGGASSNSDDNSSPDAGMPAPQGAGGSSVAQGVQRGLITGPAARLQQQQQNKKQATPNGRQNNQSKRNFNNQQGSPPNQPPAPFANSQFNPCAPPFQHSSLTNGSSKNTNGSQQGVAASQHQAFTLAQPPPMTAAPSTVIMAQQFPHYSAGQPYHQPVMGSPYPHGMPPPAQPQYVAQGDMPTAAYMQQQGPNVYHHQQQQEQPFMSQQPPQQFFQPQMPHYQQMQHSLPFMQMAPPPMPPPQHNHQAPMPPQQHMHQRPMQQQYPPHMMSHQNFPPPMPQYVQRQLGPRTAFPPPPPPPPPQQDCLPLTNGDSSTGPAAPPSPPQQKPVAAEPTPREKSPTTDSAPAATTTTDSAPAATTTTDSALAATTTTTTTAATNSKGNKKGNKNKAAKGKAYSTTRNSYTIKQRPKENESVSWRVRPVEVVPDSTSLRDDSPPESKTNGVERPCKTENTTTQDRAGSPEANNSASTKKEATNNQKEDEDTGSSSPVMTVKAKKKTKRGKKKNSAATALTVAISTTTVAKSNCKFDNERIVRMPYGPDGTKGFHLVR